MDGYRVVNTYAHTKESFTQVSKPQTLSYIP